MKKYRLKLNAYYAPTGQHNLDSLRVVLSNFAGNGYGMDKPLTLLRIVSGMKHNPPPSGKRATQYLTNAAFVHYLAKQCRFLVEVKV
jgi:hypothetical protein